MIILGWIDGCLGRHGYRSEMTSQAALEGRPDNLNEAVDTDPGAHRRFDDRAVPTVPAADPKWLKLGIGAALALTAGAALVAAAETNRDRGRHRLQGQ